MSFEMVLRELVRRGGLRKIARDLGIDHASLYKSIQDGSNVGLDRIEAILDLFGYELKMSKRKEVNLLMKGLKVSCPHCKEKVVVKQDSKGPMKCPKCKKTLVRKGRLLSSAQ